MKKQSLELEKEWKLWLEFQLWSSPVMIDAMNPTLSPYFLIKALLNILSDDLYPLHHVYTAGFHAIIPFSTWEKQPAGTHNN